MVKRIQEVHRKLTLKTPLETWEAGFPSAVTGTASMGTASYNMQTGGGTGISADGYIAVDIGGTCGYIPVLHSVR